jgi:hypothetical protein
MDWHVSALPSSRGTTGWSRPGGGQAGQLDAEWSGASTGSLGAAGRQGGRAGGSQAGRLGAWVGIRGADARQISVVLEAVKQVVGRLNVLPRSPRPTGRSCWRRSNNAGRQGARAGGDQAGWTFASECLQGAEARPGRRDANHQPDMVGRLRFLPRNKSATGRS